MLRTCSLSKLTYNAMAGILLLIAVFVTPAVSQDIGTQLTNPATGQNNNIEMWKSVRGGIQGQVSIPDKKAGVLVQSEGEAWRSIRNGPISKYGAWALFGTIAILALFFAVRGRIRIEGGMTGKTIQRFKLFERIIHWIVALSFIILSLTGLNLLYGRYIVKPWLGADTFAIITLFGKLAHNYLGIVFMVGIIIMFVIWIKHNIPNKIDLVWLSKGGGMLGSGMHPPAKKFNAGQKIIFAAVIIGGGMISYSGLMLLFPFSGNATVQDMQYVQLLHTVGALALTAVILAHIYIGTIGMEGAIHAMWSGKVEENWAKEHHSIWYNEVETSDHKDAKDNTKHPMHAPNPAE